VKDAEVLLFDLA